MTYPHVLGIVFLIAGVILQPIGWAYVRWLTPASFVLILFGVLFLFLGRLESRRKLDRAAVAGDGGGPGDVHGYSGQLHGGRSTSWEHPVTSDSDGGD